MKIRNRLGAKPKRGSSLLAALALLFIAIVGPGWQVAAQQSSQPLDKPARERGYKMLKSLKEDIKKNYYDSKFHGVDLDARFKAAEEKIGQATSIGQINGIIAQAVVDLNDSHTYFIPPPWAFRVDYGWKMQIIGAKCYVIGVKPDSDADAKGLEVGDEVLDVDGYRPTREILWKMQYYYYTLRPQRGMRVIVRSPAGAERKLELAAKIVQDRPVINFGEYFLRTIISRLENLGSIPRFHELSEDTIIWKLPKFDLTEKRVDEGMKKVKGHKTLIIDLRGNGGGYEFMLQRLVGYFFDREMKIADLKRRSEMKILKAQRRGKDRVFNGQLIILVDSNSASASEGFARVMQIEKRGTVIGDQTAGRVMRGIRYAYKIGDDKMVFYGASITDADVIMTDGKSVERIGVTPDEAVLPTGADLATKRDPVLARAAALAGVQLSPEKAGELFPDISLTIRLGKDKGDDEEPDEMDEPPPPPAPSKKN